MLLQRQANWRDSDGPTPLFHACMGGHEHAAVSLLDYGAKIADQDEQGRTVLHIVVLVTRR